MSTIIKAEHLTFSYPDEPAGHPPVLDDVSLEIESGSFVAILGHNGSGKSTLAKHMNALLTPTQGKLWVEGLDTADPENLTESDFYALDPARVTANGRLAVTRLLDNTLWVESSPLKVLG